MISAPECVAKYVRYLLEKYSIGRKYIFPYLVLHSIAFRSEIYDDRNRILDAAYMRDEYISEFSKDISEDDKDILLSWDISVFEVLLKLAIRIEDDIFTSSSNEDRTKEWFFMMLKNMDIDDILHTTYSEQREEFIKNQVDIFLDRSYGSHGHDGNIFVFSKVTYPNLDVRKMELWDQMQLWSTEQYIIDENEKKIID